MANDQFQFKQFSVLQDNVTWKVGTDGILLGAWCDVSHAVSVLDLGTGTGLLSLMIAQRNVRAHVTGIEIDAATAAVAGTNFVRSDWADRLQVVSADASGWSRDCTQKFDLVISNPPYFTEGLTSPDQKRKSARSGQTFGMKEVLDIASRLLSEQGILSVILPFEKAEEYRDQAAQLGLGCLRKMHIRHRHEISWPRSMLEFGLTHPEQTEEEYLTLFQGGEASEEYANLIAAFRNA